jgi:hypothetical protein
MVCSWFNGTDCAKLVKATARQDKMENVGWISQRAARCMHDMFMRAGNTGRTRMSACVAQNSTWLTVLVVSLPARCNMQHATLQVCKFATGHRRHSADTHRSAQAVAAAVGAVRRGAMLYCFHGCVLNRSMRLRLHCTY